MAAGPVQGRRALFGNVCGKCYHVTEDSFSNYFIFLAGSAAIGPGSASKTIVGGSHDRAEFGNRGAAWRPCRLRQRESPGGHGLQRGRQRGQYGRPVCETAPFLEACAARNGSRAAVYRPIWRCRGIPSRSARRPRWRPRMSPSLIAALVAPREPSHSADLSALANAHRNDRAANASRKTTGWPRDADDVTGKVSRLLFEQPLTQPTIVLHR